MKPCRCLLKDTDEQAFLTQVKEYLESLPEEQKADAAEYQRRLAWCLQCENLVNGFCSLCGCVAELRAAKRAQRCPALPGRW